MGIVLKVMAGDQVQIRAESYYTMPGGGVTSGYDLAAADLLAAFAGAAGFPAGKGITATDIGNIPSNPSLINSFLGGNSNGGNAKAFLCWALFDERLKFVDGDVDPVGGGGKEVHDKFLNDPVVAIQSGYLYIYVSNESNLSVFFDNLSVTHLPGAILEETLYYPFGLTIAGISSKVLMSNYAENRKKYNGIDYDKDLNIDAYETFYRTYQPQIGRFSQIDPKIEFTEAWSTYAAMYNNPIKYSDPLGDSSILGDIVDGLSTFIDDKIDNFKRNTEIEIEWVKNTIDQAGENFLARWEARADPFHQMIDNPFSMIGGVTNVEMREAAVLLPMEAKATNSATNEVSTAESTVGAAPSLKNQALDIKDNLNKGKNSVYVRTPDKAIRYDLDGTKHGGVETPHKQIFKKNFVGGVQKSISRVSKKAEPLTQQDIRMIRKFIKSQLKQHKQNPN